MRLLRRLCLALIPVALLAILAASDRPLLLAQYLPFERNKVEPIDARRAFVTGYRAWLQHDYIAAIGPMQLASTSIPELADYANFYLGAAYRDNRNPNEAADAFLRVVQNYPQSVLAPAAGLEYAKLELSLGHPALAMVAAQRAADSARDPTVEQNAMLALARAQLATNSYSAAYAEANRLREKYPWGEADGSARDIAYGILAAHPEIADTSTLAYHQREAALLLREGRSSRALAEIHAALAERPSPTVRIELTWLAAEALRGNLAAERSMLLRYLTLAPRGSHAPEALLALAHLDWRANNTAQARVYFGRVVRQFPAFAADAMFEIGRTWEDDGELDSARAEYLRLIARYPASNVAPEARFRAPFMLYMEGRYASAAAEFDAAAIDAHDPGARDALYYWNARALDRSGHPDAAAAVFRRVALSIDSNYYPALAAMRISVQPATFPAADVAVPVAAIPVVGDPLAQFHLSRVIALRDMSLGELEAGELRALNAEAVGDTGVRNFVLAEMTACGAYYDALVTATKMAARGELSSLVAERIRYPRGYWDLVSAGASRNALDPYLVAALIRQESLYDPNARSASDARGLMQLLPSTAERYASVAGVAGSPLNLYDPATSVQLGTTYLRQLFAMFNGDAFKAVAAYNGGENAVAGWLAKYPGEDDDQWVENIGFRETREYVKKVIGGRREYDLLYRGAPAQAPVPVSSPSAMTSPLPG